MIEFTVPGRPVAQPRPRFYRGFAVSDSQSSRAYKQAVAMCFANQTDRGCILTDPVAVHITAVFSRPQRHKAGRRVWRPKTPDLDNLAKSVLDALTGLAWGDDAQVCYLSVAKVYASSGENAHTRLRIMPMSEDPTDWI